MPDLIVFDCDGTILESEILSCSTDAEELTRAGFPYTTQDIVDRFLGRSLGAMLAAIERERGRPLPGGFARRLKAATARRFEAELEATPGIEAALDALSVPCCVASGSDRARLEHSLRLVGLYERFAPHVFSAEEVANGKPAPDLFLHAASALGADPARCVAVEDSPAGVEAGRAAGMRVLGFAGGRHCPPGHGAALASHGAHRVFDDMAELPASIDALG